MTFPQSDLVNIIYSLLPGFLAAWIFYGLTAHPKSSPFERVVQALIFTGIVQAIVLLIGKFLSVVGLLVSVGEWTRDVAFIWSIVIATILGITFALFSNKGWFHEFLRSSPCFKWFGGITKRTSFPSEWFSAFNRDERYIVLHLKDDRRLYGWPLEWPDSPDSGHFVIVEPAWLLDDNSRIPLLTVEKMLISSTEVEMVEFEKPPSEVTSSDDLIASAQKVLVSLREDSVPTKDSVVDSESDTTGESENE